MPAVFDRETQDAITQIAHKIGVEPAALLAVAEVESNSVAYWTVRGSKLPAIRFEGHYFYARLKGDALREAIQKGLASKRVGGVKNPRSYTARYDLLERALLIGAREALESTSWGLGQVMGANWKDLGYQSVEDLVNTAKGSIAGQVEVMAKFIEKNGLIPHLKTKNWKAFARRYNGPKYWMNKYDKKMASAYARYKGGTAANGSIRDVQRDLAKLGYAPGPIDGVAGIRTVQAVKKFQEDNDLVADGIVGPMTREAINEALARKKVTTASRDTKIGVISSGIGTAGTTLTETAGTISMVSDYSDTLKWLFVGLLVAGALLTAWAVIRRTTADEQVEALVV